MAGNPRPRGLQRAGNAQRARQDIHRLQQQPRTLPQREPMVSPTFTISSLWLVVQAELSNHIRDQV